MSRAREENDIIRLISRWFSRQSSVRAVALVGSHARGDARTNSDIDFVIVTDSPNDFLQHRDWTGTFGVAAKVVLEDWGMVRSIRVFYHDGPEVEFGFTTRAWCRIPVDPGTAEVVGGGLEILFDTAQLLEMLKRTVESARST